MEGRPRGKKRVPLLRALICACSIQSMQRKEGNFHTSLTEISKGMEQKVGQFKRESEVCGLGDFFLQLDVAENGYQSLYISSKLFFFFFFKIDQYYSLAF